MPLNFQAICVSCPMTHDCSLAGLAASTFGLTKQKYVLGHIVLYMDSLPPTFS